MMGRPFDSIEPFVKMIPLRHEGEGVRDEGYSSSTSLIL